MAYVQAEVEAKVALLETALARGELRVDFADRSVTYRSVDELKKALSYFQDILAGLAAAAGTGRPRQLFAVSSNGF